MLQKFRFYSGVATLYILTIGTIGVISHSSQLYGEAVQANDNLSTAPLNRLSSQPIITYGKPIRITIPERGIDLKVNDGYYDKSTKTWSLTETDAHYAVMSSIANDHAGTTFIYGHGTDAVFGKIGTNPPPKGSIAQLHTNNGHVFTYKLEHVVDLKPTDTWVLGDTTSGQPRLIVQTCTGAMSEWRTMFVFSFSEVK